MDISFPVPDTAAARPRSTAAPREATHPADRERGKGEDFGSVLQDPQQLPAIELADAGADPAADPAAADILVAIVAMPAPPPTDAVDLPPADAPDLPSPTATLPAAELTPPPPTPIEDSSAPAADGDMPVAAQGPTPRQNIRPSGMLPVTAPGSAPRADAEAPAPDGPIAPVALRRADAPAEGAQPMPTALLAPPARSGDDPASGQDVRLLDAPEPAWQLTEATARPARAEATVHPLAAAPASPAPRQVVAQVAVAIGEAPDDQRLEIRLDPPELGRVQIHLTRHDGAVQAVVLADRPETQDLLRRHSDLLASELDAAGYEGVSLDFPRPDAQPERASPPSDDWGQTPAPPATVPEPVAVMLRDEARGSFAGGLDIRL